MKASSLIPARAWCCVGAGIVVATACSGRSQDADAARAAIAQARQEFWDAHEQGDAAALVALVTDSAVLFAPGMEEVRGRDALRDAAEQMFAAMAISDFTIIDQEMDIHGSSAYELATYSETVRVGDGEARSVRGRYLLVWRKEADGEWRVHRNMFHFVTPAPF